MDLKRVNVGGDLSGRDASIAAAIEMALWLQGKAARRTLGGLKSAIWRAAKKCAEVLP